MTSVIVARLPFENLTYADLFTYADLVRSSNVEPSEKVQTFSAEESAWADGFEVELMAADYRSSAVLSPVEVAELVDMLDGIAEGDGDARAYVEAAKDFKDRLLGR